MVESHNNLQCVTNNNPFTSRLFISANDTGIGILDQFSNKNTVQGASAFRNIPVLTLTKNKINCGNIFNSVYQNVVISTHN